MNKILVAKEKCKEHAEHPDHSAHIGRLRRAQGQIEGVCGMIEERRYCPEILIQIRAAVKALEAVESEILGGHLHGCVKKAMHSKNEREVEKKIQEIVKLMRR